MENQKSEFLKDSLEEKYEEFLKQYSEEPSFAEADIAWKDTGEICEGMIFRLSNDSDETIDDRIFYYLRGYKDIEDLCYEGMQDFVIIKDSVKFLNSI